MAARLASESFLPDHNRSGQVANLFGHAECTTEFIALPVCRTEFIPFPVVERNSFRYLS